MKTKLLIFLTFIASIFIQSASQAQILFEVKSPSHLAGNYNFAYPSDWGADLNTTYVYDTLVIIRDWTSADSLGCDSTMNLAQVNNQIAVVYRGACEFSKKALEAQNAGALALIVINNVAGSPFAMGIGTYGLDITIPVVMISKEDGELLKSAIDAGEVTAFIGNKAGLYDYDLTIADNVLRPRFFASPQNNNDFKSSIGAWIQNIGKNFQNDVQLLAEISLNNNILYSSISANFVIPSGNSVFIQLPDFHQQYYDSGYYTLTYKIISGTMDESPGDNSKTTNFWINNSLYSKSRINPITSEPLKSGSWRTGMNYRTCIVLDEKNSGNSRVDALSFSATTGTISIEGEVIETEIYKWNDSLSNGYVSFNDIQLVGNSVYNYTSDLRDVFITHPFAEPVQLENNARYLLCVRTANGLYIGADNAVNYQNQIEPDYYGNYFPTYDFDSYQWYEDGLGTNNIPAIIAHLSAGSAPPPPPDTTNQNNGQAKIVFEVKSPAHLAGNYNFAYPTDWAADLNITQVYDTLVVIRDWTSADSLGCDSTMNMAQVNNQIAVVYRGACEFSKKALEAQNAGALALIVINNVAGSPFAMGIGTYGPEITIPVIMISKEDGELLKSAIDAGEATALIGNKAGLYDYDLTVADNVLRPRFFAIPQNNTDIKSSIGAWIQNSGKNAQNDVQLLAEISLNNNILYSSISANYFISAGNSVFIQLPDFHQQYYESGYYTLTYKVISGTMDESPGDNSKTTNFWINNSLYSKSRINPMTSEPFRTGSWRTGMNYSACIVLDEKNSGNSRVDALSFSATTGGNSIEGEVIETEIYKWNDYLSNGYVSYNDIQLVGNSVYNYPSDLRDVFITHPFAEPVQLENNARYLLCVRTANGLYIGADNAINYQNQIEPDYHGNHFPAYNFDSGQWSEDGLGPNNIPAIIAHLSAGSAPPPPPDTTNPNNGQAQIVFEVKSPSHLAGNYNFAYPTDWGADLNITQVYDTLVVIRDSTSVDSLGCQPTINFSQVNNQIAVVYRGACEFSKKALEAQNAGALALIVINNVAGSPFAMGMGTYGPEITIPVIMISKEDGELLKSAIDSGEVTALIGNKAGLYDYDLTVADNVLRPRFFAIPQNNTDIKSSIGAWIQNNGKNAQHDVQLLAEISLNNNILYSSTSANYVVHTGNSVFIQLPDFHQQNYDSGYYALTYKIISGTMDESPGDNSKTTNFWINNSLYSKSRINPMTSVPNRTGSWRSGMNYRACIVLDEKNSGNSQVDALTFSATTGGSSIEGEVMETEIYKWNDYLSNGAVVFNDLQLIGNSVYNYSSDQRDVFITHPFAEPVQLENNARYLLCVRTENGLYIGADNGINYENQNEPNYYGNYFPIFDFDAYHWNEYGFGQNNIPIIIANLSASAPRPPVAHFAVNGNNACNGETLFFYDNSSGIPTSWLWNFGDGASSTLQNPTHAYINQGNYNVTLQVFNEQGSDSSSQIITVGSPASPAPWADQNPQFSARREVFNISSCGPNTAWASASGPGTFYTKTTDGVNWKEGRVITDSVAAEQHHFSQLFALDEKVAWALFYNTLGGGAVYQTIDGGTSWTEQTTASFSGQTSFPNAIHFFDANNGVIMGDPNGGSFEIYTTSNGGNNWTRVSSNNIPAPLSGSEYGTTSIYSAVGESIWFPTQNGRVFKSVDRGLTWTVSGAIGGNISQIAFINEQEGIAQTWSGLIKTSDGGLTWNSFVHESGISHYKLTTTNDQNPYYISYTYPYGTSYSSDGMNWIDIDRIGHTALGFYNKSTGWGAFSAHCDGFGLRKLDPAYLPKYCPIVLSLEKTDIGCNGDNNGTATVSATGGSGIYNYTWNTNPMQTQEIATGLVAGTYTVTVSDSSCSVSGKVTISEPQPISIIIHSTVSCYGGNDASATAMVYGDSSSYTYSWNTNPVQTSSTATGLAPGTYTLTISNGNCSKSEFVTITEHTSPSPWANQDPGFSTRREVFNISVCGPSTAWASAKGPGTFYTRTTDGIIWQEGRVITDSVAAGKHEFSQLFALNNSIAWALFYNTSGGGAVYQTMDGGTSWTEQTTASFSGQSSFPNVVHFFDANNGVIMGDPEGGSFEIYTTSNGGTTWTRVSSANIPAPLSGSEYGTTSKYSAVGETIWFPTQHGRVFKSVDRGLTWTVGEAIPSGNIEQIAFINEQEGIVHSGSWLMAKTSDGGLTWSSSSVQSGFRHYNLTTTKDNHPYYISYAHPYGTSYSSDGMNWLGIDSIGHKALDFYNRSTAWAAFSDQCNGMRKLDPDYLPTYCPIAVSIVKTDITCNGNNNGTATVTVTGGSGPYNYSWNTNPPQTTETATGLQAGTYTVIVSDSSCSASGVVTITEPQSISIIIHSTVSCYGGNDATATAIVSGDSGSYTYSWNTNPVQTGATATGLIPGTYTVTVSNGNCSKSEPVTITELASHNPWTNQDPGFSTRREVFNISVCGPSSAWASAKGPGTFYTRTTDGIIWQEGRVITDSIAAGKHEFSQLFALNNSIAWALFYNTSGGGAVYKTIDAGTSWTKQITASFSGQSSFPNVVHFFDANNGVIVGDPEGSSFEIYTTSNGGTTWTRVSSANIPPPLSGSEYGTTSKYSAVGESIWFPTQNGRVFKSVDKGLTWTVSEAIPSGNIEQIAFINEQEGIVHSGSWLMAKTSDGGLTWSSSSVQSGFRHYNLTTTKDNHPYYISYAHPYGTSYSSDGMNWLGIDSIGHIALGFYNRSTAWAAFSDQCDGMRKLDPDYLPMYCEITANITKADISCNGNNNGTATVTANGGSGTYTYSWNTNPPQTTATATGLQAGTYTVKVSDGNCSTTGVVIITEPSPVSIVENKTNASCYNCADGSITLAVSGGTGPYIYTWTPGGATTPSITNLLPGKYTVTVTDSAGCTQKGSYTMVYDCEIVLTSSLTNVSCSGACNGSATVTASNGKPPYSYLWSNGSSNATATGLCAGDYTVTVTDADSCSQNLKVNISEPASTISVTVSSAPTTCPNGNDGTATATASGGTGNYTYSWNATPNQTTATATGLKAGIYLVTVTDGNGCKATASVTVTQPPAILLFSNKVNSSCLNCADGSINISMSGGITPYTYSWNTGANTPNVSGLVPGVYTVTVTDNRGCVVSSKINITSFCNLSLNTSSVNPNCVGKCNGTATVSVSGGSSPYTYTWSNARTGATLTDLCAGTYKVSVKDAAGCTSTGEVTLTDPAEINLSVATNMSACNKSTGSATVSVSGGAAPYAYLWSNGSKTNKAEGLASGVYTATVTDNNGCKNTITTTMSDNGAPSITVNSVTHIPCYGGNNGSIDIGVSGGVLPYQYLWSNGYATEDLSDLQGGPYEIIVMSADSCIAMKSIEVNEPKKMNLILDVTKASCGSEDGSASVTVSGGTAPYTYLWSTGSILNQADSLGAGTYSLGITDNQGCSFDYQVPVGELGGPEIAITSIIGSSCDQANGSVYVNVTGGTPGYAFNWSNGSSDENLYNVEEGIHSLTVTDAAGCRGINTAEVTGSVPSMIDVCILITVDEEINKNKIVFEKAQGSGILYYNIYRESSQPNVYFKIGTLPFDSVSVFTDTVANPMTRAWKYKVGAVDECGNESEQTPRHKSIHLTISKGSGNSIDIVWSPYEGFDFGKYYLYRHIGNDVKLLDSIASNENSYTDLNPPAGDIYYHIETLHPVGCDVSRSGYNSSKSNKSTQMTIEVPDMIVNSEEGLHKLSVYPNPTRNTLNITGEVENDKEVMIYLMDMQGRVVFKQELKSENRVIKGLIDTSPFSSGIYQLKFKTEKGLIYKKVVINH